MLIPIPGVTNVIFINGISSFHIMACTSKFTWMYLNSFPSMVYVDNSFMGIQIPITGVVKSISINGNL